MKTKLLNPLSKPWTPRDYQKVAVKFLLEHACAGLLLDPGLGKTSSTLAAYSFLKKKHKVGKMLLIAPLRPCYTVWPNEIKKWSDFNHITCAIAHGKNKEAAITADVDLVIINPEGLDWLLGVKREKYTTRTGKERYRTTVDMKRFLAMGFDILCIDELSKFKHYNTGRFEALKHVLHTFGRRWGLTGSPASNGLLDLFGQCYILDLGNALGGYITHYRDTYFVADKYGHSFTLQPGAEERIYEAIEPLMLRMGNDQLDMPRLVENNIWVDLPDDVMETYLQLEKDFITAIDTRIVTVANAAAASSKIRQVANGGIYLDPKVLPSGLQAPKSAREWANLHSKKTEALRDLVDELQGSPLLVAYDFEHDLDRLRAAFKDGAFACDYNMKAFDKLVAKWNHGEIPLLFGHPQSIGHGNNMQGACHHVAWHSMTWNRELYDQFIARVWRQGNESDRVFVHHIMAKDTIDAAVYGALQFKHSTEQALFEGILRYAKERRG